MQNRCQSCNQPLVKERTLCERCAMEAQAGQAGRCEICGQAVMGCEEDDGCRATRLCKRHYWLMVEICDPSGLGNVGEARLILPSKMFGAPSASETEKIRGWFARWSGEGPESGHAPLN